MAPSLGFNEERYKFSRCSINQFRKNLLYEHPKGHYTISKKYNCLVEKESDSNYIRYYKQPNYKQLRLMGYYYSLSDQCRIMSGLKSMALSIPNNKCTIVECLIGANKYEQYALMDGTPCGVGKICYSAKCLQMDELKTLNDDFQQQTNFNKQTTSTYLDDQLDSSARLLRELCPQGADQELQTNEYNYTRHTCDEALLKYNYDLCEDLPYKFLCCEKCLKYKLNKCTNCSDDKRKCMRHHSECKIVTCESLTENPCYNGGICITNHSELNIATAKTAFYCKCPRGYSGN
jgi:hypothetical protein